MAATVKFKWKGTCPKHPRYNPDQGENAIRGGCEFCHALLAISRTIDRAADASRAYEYKVRDYNQIHQKGLNHATA